jgi:hypothetical protein
MVIPGVDLALILPEFILETAQRSDIVEGMDVAGDQLR